MGFCRRNLQSPSILSENWNAQLEQEMNKWSAWYPVYTSDAGMVWAWPWQRVDVFWRHPPWLASIPPQFQDEMPGVEFFARNPKG